MSRSLFSTTVRFTSRLAERLAPDWVERQAFARWGRPERPPARWGAALQTARRFHLEVAATDLAAWEWNVGGAAGTALLVHGWSGNASQLDSFVAPLVGRGFHVVAVDLPAHGETAGDFATLPLLADVLVSLGARLQPEVIIAHSLGATSAAYALTRGLRPARLALLAPPAQLPPYLQHFTDFLGLSSAMHARLLRRVEQTVLFQPIEALDLLRHAPRLGHVRALLVHDEADAVVPVASSRALAAGWPAAELMVTRGLSHDRVRRDAAVVERVVAFVAGEPAAAERSAA